MTETLDPSALPLGALLRDPSTGRWAVRFQVDDTTGKGMHAWIVPPTEQQPEVRVLHHVEVRGWEPAAVVVDEIKRLAKLAEANSSQARFWADHFAEIDKANREALGAHHKPGHTVAELVAELVQELGDLRASREAWALEADRLDVIVLAARYYVQPETCDGSDCDHDDEVCVHMDELYATADDALAARQVPWLEGERERLLSMSARFGDFVLDVAEALGMPPSTSNDDLLDVIAELRNERRQRGGAR